jgi:hypothetical protein
VHGVRRAGHFGQRELLQRELRPADLPHAHGRARRAARLRRGPLHDGLQARGRRDRAARQDEGRAGRQRVPEAGSRTRVRSAAESRHGSRAAALRAARDRDPHGHRRLGARLLGRRPGGRPRGELHRGRHGHDCTARRRWRARSLRTSRRRRWSCSPHSGCPYRRD